MSEKWGVGSRLGSGGSCAIQSEEADKVGEERRWYNRGQDGNGSACSQCAKKGAKGKTKKKMDWQSENELVNYLMCINVAWCKPAIIILLLFCINLIKVFPVTSSIGVELYMLWLIDWLIDWFK